MINLPIGIKSLTGKYQSMLAKIETNLPAIAEGQENFYKSQSQFMDNMLTVSHPTPIRNLRQILAEINKAKSALDEAFFKNKKKEVRIRQKQEKIKTSDGLDQELLEIEIAEKQSQINATTEYMKGAIRKISAYIEQYNSILEYIGKDSLSEEDFEKEESRYHIGKAFEQSLIAARAHGGRIDEGNHIYLHQIGINGAMAQMEITKYLGQEVKLFSEQKAPTHAMTLHWLNALMNKYESHPEVYAKIKGMKLLDTESLKE